MAEVELGDEVNLSKGERKARKALAKHGLKPVSAITRVTIKKRNTLFVVATPAVYKLGADTYVVFGEVKVEDANQIAQQAQQWAQQDLAGDSEADAARLADDILDGAGAAAPDDGDEIPDLVDGADVEEKDVELVMSQANVSRAKALQALRANNNDIVNAIMELTL